MVPAATVSDASQIALRIVGGNAVQQGGAERGAGGQRGGQGRCGGAVRRGNLIPHEHQHAKEADHEAHAAQRTEAVLEPQEGDQRAPQRRGRVDHRRDARRQRQLRVRKQAERRRRIQDADHDKRQRTAAQGRERLAHRSPCEQHDQEEQRADADPQGHQRCNAEVGHADPDEEKRRAPQGGEDEKLEQVFGIHGRRVTRG
jgi:hypothetical protein